MKCIILCAGYATRLYPLTENYPKPLLKVGKQAILDHIMDKVAQLPDIDEVLIVTNDRFFSHFQDWHTKTKQNASIKIINDGTKSNDDRLGAVGDVVFTLKQHKIDEDMLLIAGDNLFDFSLKDMKKEFKKRQANIVAVHDIKDKSKLARRFGVVITNSDGRIIDFEEKPENPKTSLAATACYMFTKSGISKIKDYLVQTNKKDNPGDFVQWLIQHEPVYAHTFSGHWFDIGSVEALEEASRIYKSDQQ